MVLSWAAEVSSTAPKCDRGGGYGECVPMTAKYATTCGVCASGVSPGEEIAKSGTRWAHAACAETPGGTVATPGVSPAKSAKTARPARPDMPAADGALEVWTDGACSGNPGPGGWAWATRDGRQDSGGEARTTNQRMEIRAALEAVRALPGPLVVVSDSTYVVNCFRDGWWKGWIARGWLTSAKKPVVSRDLWEPLVTLVNERGDVTFRWVKGHSGDEMNDLVDALAVEQSHAVA
jgi:ribonuclease HI